MAAQTTEVQDLREQVLYEGLDSTSLFTLAEMLCEEIERSKLNAERGDWYTMGLALSHRRVQEKLVRLEYRPISPKDVPDE